MNEPEELFPSDDVILDVMCQHELTCRCRLCMAFVNAPDQQAGVIAVRALMQGGAQ